MFLCFYLSYVPLCLTVLIQFSTAQFFIYYSVSLFFISVILTTTFVLNLIFSAFLSPILLFKVFFCLLWFGISYRLIVFLRFFFIFSQFDELWQLGFGHPSKASYTLFIGITARLQRMVIFCVFLSSILLYILLDLHPHSYPFPPFVLISNDSNQSVLKTRFSQPNRYSEVSFITSP